MIEFFTALGLAFVIEGIIYAAFPDFMKRMMVQILSLPAQQGLLLRLRGLRLSGLQRVVFKRPTLCN